MTLWICNGPVPTGPLVFRNINGFPIQAKVYTFQYPDEEYSFDHTAMPAAILPARPGEEG
jgi:hypothetical protein